MKGRAITDVRTYEPNQARSKKGEGTRKPFIPFPSGRGKFASFGRELCGSRRGRDFCHEFGRFKGGGSKGSQKSREESGPREEGGGTSLLPLLFPLSPSTVTVEKERGKRPNFFVPNSLLCLPLLLRSLFFLPKENSRKSGEPAFTFVREPKIRGERTLVSRRC